MAQYDISTKYLLLEHPKALLEYFLGRQNIEIIEHLNTNQPTFKTHRGDSTTRVRIVGSAAAEAESLETFLQTLGAQTNAQNGTKAP